MTGLDSKLAAFLGQLGTVWEELEPDIPFPPEEYRNRLEKLRARMAESGIDLLLLTSPEAICWLHGYRSRWNKAQSPSAWPPLQTTAVHVDHDRFIVFETAGHEYQLRLTSISSDNRMSIDWSLDTMLPFIMRELAAEGWLKGTVGLEKMSYIPNRVVSEAVEASLVERGCGVVDASALTRQVRHIKSPLEIEYMEKAAGIADAGLLALKESLRPGMTELEAWGELIRGMAAAGGEPAGLHESVIVGPNGHFISSRRQINRGDYVAADPSGVIYGYHANIAGAFFLGEPPDEARRIVEIGAGALEVLCQTAKSGTPVRQVNRALREYLQDCGLWGSHGWSDDDWIGGYDLGISFPPDWVGEFVFTASEEDAEGLFEAGMVTNFESLVHIPVVDTVVYGEQGGRSLSALPHEVFGIE
jgi:Xaa-Pro aminopeptidase